MRVASIDRVGAEPRRKRRSPCPRRRAPISSSRHLAPADAAKAGRDPGLALPHKVTAEGPGLIAAGVKVVDMSGDFRHQATPPSTETYYGREAAAPPSCSRARSSTGCPSSTAPRSRQASIRRVARLLLRRRSSNASLPPARHAGLSSTARSIHVQGITGSSGSCIAPQAGHASPEPARTTSEDVWPLDHQHVPPIVQARSAMPAPGTSSLRFNAGIGA